MVSLGSLSFIEHFENPNLPSIQHLSSVPCHLLNCYRLSARSAIQKGRFGFQKVHCCKNQLGFSSNDEISVSGCCKVLPLMGKGRKGMVVLRATGKNTGGDENDADDALQATIEKSKKVLAMQRDLLQQIAERRKLVSSIKKSIGGQEEEIDASSESDDSFSNFAQELSDEEPDQDYKNAFFPNNFARSTAVEISENPFVGADNRFDDKEQESGKSFVQRRSPRDLDAIEQVGFVQRRSPRDVDAIEQVGFVQRRSPRDVDAIEQVGEATLENAQSKLMPSTVTKTLKTTDLDGEKVKESKKYEVEGRSDEADAGSEEVVTKPPPLAGANVMNVILVAAECAPWSKTGGLGDVAGALPKALARRGHRVMVVAPRYSNYSEAHDMGIRKKYIVAGQDMEVSYFQTYIDGVDFVFIDNPMFYSCSNNIYGGNRLDILKRMVLFCKAAVEAPWHVPCGGVCYGDGNLVFIANDWHTALLPVYLKAYYRDQGLMKYTRSVLVIHNIAHQGRGPVDDFTYVDLPDHYKDLFKLYDPMGGEHFNIFAAGLKTADRILTVSCGYAWELKTLEGGWGLHEIINENDWKFKGIVNGIDPEDWNPELDVHLKSDGYTNYSLETLLTGKPQCKEALQKELGLPVRADVPLIGFIGRLDNQKGVDLIAEAIPWMVSQDLQLVMLGTGREDLENMLRQFEGKYQDKVRGWVGFSVKTAHRITAGADILLMPSRFEPCGLNQLYAMRYGTVPVVHAVGGLRDTVQPFDPFNESGLGWTFERAESSGLIHALGNCLWTYRDFKESWKGIQRRGMSQDLSWDNAAQHYEEVLVAAKYQW